MRSGSAKSSQNERFRLILTQIRRSQFLLPQQLSLATSRNIERILYSITVVVNGCFDSHGWTFSESRCIGPPDVHLNVRDFQYLCDKITEITYSQRKLHSPEFHINFHLSPQILQPYVIPRLDSLTNLLELIRIFLRLSRKTQNDRILKLFLGYMKCLARSCTNLSREMVHILDGFLRTPPNYILSTLFISSLKLLFTLESIIGPDNIAMLTYWSDFYDNWRIDCPDTRFHQLKQLLDVSDNQHGYDAPKSIAILDCMATLAGRSSSSLTVQHSAEALATNLVNRCRRVVTKGTPSFYCDALQYLENGTIVLGRILLSSNLFHRFQIAFEYVIDLLEQADVFAMERAAHHLDYVITSLIEARALSQVAELEERRKSLAIKLTRLTRETEAAALLRGNTNAEELGYILQDLYST
jgi:hypothetical protein